MYSFFNFTRGEWAISIFLLFVTVGLLLFGHFYQYQTKNHFNIERFEQVIAQFTEEEQRYNDSLEEVKKVWQKRQPYTPQKYMQYSGYQSLDSGKMQKWNISEKYTIVKINLNSCDTLEMMKVPLFGRKRATKLIEYREKLGGFHSLQQIREVYILQNITLEHLEKYFMVNSQDIRKITINTATYEELMKHPYFDAYLTKSILYYRKKNLYIRNIEEFKQATNLYQELLEKVEPYLSFDIE
jgi:DNA uptake protein ComE-like DNA-binding protein